MQVCAITIIDVGSISTEDGTERAPVLLRMDEVAIFLTHPQASHLIRQLEVALGRREAEAA